MESLTETGRGGLDDMHVRALAGFFKTFPASGMSRVGKWPGQAAGTCPASINRFSACKNYQPVFKNA